MPLYKRTPFLPKDEPTDLRPDESVFYLKLTNEIFRDYDEYFERVIMCNSLVWACSVTGKINLTFEEAVESERQARKTLVNFAPELKKALLYLVNQTQRGRVSDVIEDVFSFAKEHYFIGETVLGVIGNLWCHSRVLRVIQPTPVEIEQYKKDLEEKGELQNNDYLKDDSWGPPPDLFRYELIEIEPDDPDIHETHILEAIDVKREKLIVTKEKCKYLIKSSTFYNEEERVWRVMDDIWKSLRLQNAEFDGGLFIGNVPQFESCLGPAKKINKPRSRPSKPSPVPVANQSQPKKESTKNFPIQNGFSKQRPPRPSRASGSGGPVKKKKSIPQPVKQVVTLSPLEQKQLEIERKAKERESIKEKKKLILDFKKLWMKPKDDLDVEDLQDLPVPDPVSCKIPNDFFGDFVMILEYFSCYASFLRVKESFPQGLSFEALERGLIKAEVAGPLSDILQILLRGIFRLQEREDADVTQEERAPVELALDETSEDVSVVEAIEQATAAATWSLMYQSLPIYKLPLDHLSLTEVLRLHLLASGARPKEKDIKWRLSMRGGYSNREDPGLQFRLEEPQVLKILSQGTVFDLSFQERIKLVLCLIHQLLSYADLRDTIDDTYDQFKQARADLRALQAAERKSEHDDNVWRMKLKAERIIPEENGVKKELTDAEIEGFMTKKLREALRRKEEFEWKASELSGRIHKQERMLGLHPLGRDRAFRRYWVFPSLSGIFVEDDIDHLGPCLAEPTPHIPNPDIQDIGFIKQHFKRLAEADENSSTKTQNRKSPAKKLPLPTTSIFGLCRGNINTCPVHSTSLRGPKWSFFWQDEHLDALITNLSPRGIREKELRLILTEEAEGIRNLLKKCPAAKLNRDKTYPEEVEKRRTTLGKSGIDPNLNYPPKTPMDTILELQLRDLILEAEEKIQMGTLGSLKVKDRSVWVKAIETRGYDEQAQEIRWGVAKSLSNEDEEDGRSRRSPGSKDEKMSNSVLRDLASAILQLEQSIEPKFLKKPLGTDKEEKESKKRSRNDGEGAQLRPNWIPGTPIERWETSLMKSTTYSQLFMHFFTLDQSISWNRSVLNVRCRICRRKGDSENMLLCDGCNKGHHAYCFKPPLEIIPKGDWFCRDCAPPPLPPTPRRARREEEEDESDDEGPPTLEEITEVCIVCNVGGEVICCDGCPALFHLECLDPPKTRVPRGLWYCDHCKEKKEGGSSSSRRSRPKKTQRKRPLTTTSGESDEEDSTPEEETIDESGGDASDVEEDEEEEPTPVKVRIVKSPRKRPPRLTSEESEAEEEEEEQHLGRGVKRKSAYRAVLKISQVAKRLRSDSKENETSESSNDSNGVGGFRKGSMDSDGGDNPKRTRLQRMNTNQCGDSGDLDNVLLGRLIVDVMRHPDAWPFLKPVTRSEAPDYHEIVKNPMDLGTIKYKLNSMVYTCNQEFLGDLQLVFENCFSYNAPDAPVHQAGEDLRLYCKRRCEKAGLHFADPSTH